MKRLVFAALAIAAMAACTKSNVQLEQPGEITLQPVAQKATKAAVDGASYPTDVAYNFNVWAWWKDCNAGTKLKKFIESTPTPYIAEGEFIFKQGSWRGNTPYYWPTKGSLVFAGYSPASAASNGTFKYVVADSTFQVTNYIQSNNISESKDLMWFDVTDISYDNNGTAGVPVTFKHALSWLTFNFNLAEGAPQNWRVKDVTLTGIENMATFTARKGSTLNWTIPTPFPDTNNGEINVYNNGEGVTITNTGKVLENTPDASLSKGAVLVIPQSCTNVNASLVITYDLKNHAHGVIPDAPEYLQGQQVTLPLNGGNVGDAWKVGKHYIYTITFGANEILIAPEVADWGEPVNIPVQK